MNLNLAVRDLCPLFSVRYRQPQFAQRLVKHPAGRSGGTKGCGPLTYFSNDDSVDIAVQGSDFVPTVQLLIGSESVLAFTDVR